MGVTATDSQWVYGRIMGAEIIAPGSVCSAHPVLVGVGLKLIPRPLRMEVPSLLSVCRKHIVYPVAELLPLDDTVNYLREHPAQ